MNQGDFHSRYNYSPQSHYVAPRRGFMDKIFGERISRTLRSPLVITAGLLLTGGAFAALIVSAYPDAAGNNGNAPIVQADGRPYKSEPMEVGGMDIPNRDSTIFDTMRTAENGEGAGRVENLLDPSSDEEASSEEVAQAPAEPEDITLSAQAPEQTTQSASAQPAPAETAQAQPKAVEVKPPETVHVPGSSPETLAFVRSVLDDEAAEPATPQATPLQREQRPTASASTETELAKVAPASGAAKTTASAIVGNYFVQLSSIREESIAPKEWAKLQNTYPSLQGMKYRVQEANLGERGIYYRIQAGPFSKEEASSICGKIEAQKSGGCLVVKK